MEQKKKPQAIVIMKQVKELEKEYKELCLYNPGLEDQVA